jgi:hypothetical protein
LLTFFFKPCHSTKNAVSQFIEFDNDPRGSISGHYLKALLENKVDFSEEMALAAVRMLRRDEALCYNAEGVCHYVTHLWAVKT